MTFPDLNGVTWTDIGGGLKIHDKAEGDGAAAPANCRVEVHYTGWLTDGTKFDSSVDRGQTITFGLNQVIAGWQKGIPGMKPGGTRLLYIPYALAYGDRGSPGAIPPKADLVFEVALVKVR